MTGLRRAACRAFGALALAALTVVAASPATAQKSVTKQGISQLDTFVTTGAYVTTFYPLWFTYYQSQVASVNRLVGPDRISAIYQIVVAINDDTAYASTFIDLSVQPVVLTVPVTTGAYSVLTLDTFGNVFESGIPSQAPGTLLPAATYLLYGPGYAGSLPSGVTPIALQNNHAVLIFRVDKYSPSGQDQRVEANRFRSSLATVPLCSFLGATCPANTPPGGSALILPEIAFSPPFKTIADALIAVDPIEFLRQLQVAVKAPSTPPLSEADRALASRFDALFGDGTFKDPERNDLFMAGAQAAHELIVERYLTHRGPTQWIHFTNIGQWGDAVVDRAAITEYIQYGNTAKTAAYYHTFRDSRGKALDGRRAEGYVLTFAKDEIPQAARFWSVTAYTPHAIELVANPGHKYVVASYTPGLATNADGSITIHLAHEQPDGVPFANWLPIPRHAFNVMLRVYGPEGSVAANQYVPPAVEVVR